MISVFYGEYTTKKQSYNKYALFLLVIGKFVIRFSENAPLRFACTALLWYSLQNLI